MALKYPLETIKQSVGSIMMQSFSRCQTRHLFLIKVKIQFYSTFTPCIDFHTFHIHVININH